MASCCSHVDILVIMAAPTRRFGVDVSSWGRLVEIPGAWFFLKDCTISAKLGSHVGFFYTSLSGDVDTCSKIVCLLGVEGVQVVATIVVKGMMRGLEHPRKGWSKRNLWDEPSASYSSPMPSWPPGPLLPLPWNYSMMLSSSKVKGGHLQGHLCQ